MHFYVGQHLDILSYLRFFHYNAKVVSISPTHIKVKYICETWPDEWLRKDDSLILPALAAFSDVPPELSHIFLSSLRVGDLVEAKIPFNSWYKATITYIDYRRNRIQVHVINHNTSNKWVELCDVAELYTHTQPEDFLSAEVAESSNQRNVEAPEGEACVVCLHNPKNVLVLPCRHLCLCDECQGSFGVMPKVRQMVSNKCPVCVEPISSLVVVYK